jgi:hypothetical protein
MVNKLLFMRIIRLTISAIALFLVYTACKKTNSPANAKTVQDLSGSYKITAISVTASGITFDEFASLKDCEKDNIIKLNMDLTAQFIDTGIVCVPPETANGTWNLFSNNDSLSLTGVPAFPNGVTGFIKSWDGTTLVLAGSQVISNQLASTTITLYKQ